MTLTLTQPGPTVTPAPTPAEALMIRAFAALIDATLMADGSTLCNALTLLDAAMTAGLAEVQADGVTLAVSMLGVAAQVPDRDGPVAALRQWQTAAQQHLSGVAG